MEELDFTESYSNERKLPRVSFIHEVEKYLYDENLTAEKALERLQEDYSKFKLIEQKLLQSHSRSMSKMPEIEKNLEVIEFLQENGKADLSAETSESINVTFPFGDTLHIDCQLEKSSSSPLGVWLGANVMVEYSCDEAKELLMRNQSRLRTNIQNTTTDIAFVREQIIVLEVNMARVYNHDVQRRKSTS
mmetsp:Transcript_1586/g.2455  ORF Transcript_1586/g.2455 Transcript_1586/m.2455 type:complete len:190 (-) Transcript_1586:120-689(-)